MLNLLKKKIVNGMKDPINKQNQLNWIDKLLTSLLRAGFGASGTGRTALSLVGSATGFTGAFFSSFRSGLYLGSFCSSFRFTIRAALFTKLLVRSSSCRSTTQGHEGCGMEHIRYRGQVSTLSLVHCSETQILWWEIIFSHSVSLTALCWNVPVSWPPWEGQGARAPTDKAWLRLAPPPPHTIVLLGTWNPCFCQCIGV